MALTADELAAQFRQEITSGKLPMGAKMPSLNQIVKTRGVGKGVAQQAMDKLRAEGLIASRHGAGNYVQGGFGRTALVRSSLTQPDRNVEIDDEKTVVVRVDEVLAPPTVRTFLFFDADDADAVAVMRQWRTERDGRALQTHEAYFPVSVARGSSLLYHDLGPDGIVGKLADLGHQPDRVVERLIGRKATGAEGDSLGLRVGAMVLEVVRVMYAAEACVAVWRSVLDADAYELMYDLSLTYDLTE